MRRYPAQGRTDARPHTRRVLGWPARWAPSWI